MERRRYGQQRRNLSSYSSPSSFAGLSSSSSSNSYKNSNVNGSGDSKFRRNSGKVQQLLQQQEVEEEATAIVGTCQFMCPEDEKAQRERLRDLSVFERLHGDPRKSSPGLAVKKFCRTITTKLTRSSDVRPLPVLEDTLNYLLNLLNSTEHPFEVVHDFVFDRTRSIRQDLSMQNIVNDKVIRIYEKIVKFHVISHHKLRTGCDNSTISSMLHLNMEQLTKALTSLYHLYEANRGSISTYENEPEFHSLYVLLHLDCNGQAMGESLSLWFRHLPLPIIKSKEMHFARQVLRYFRMGNYRRFLCTTAAEASYLQYCIMEPYIDEVRALALTCINNGGYKLHPYPLSHLSKLLKMEESDVESLCKACGLETCTDEEGNKLLPAKQTTFCRPKGFLGYGLLGLQQLEK